MPLLYRNYTTTPEYTAPPACFIHARSAVLGIGVANKPRRRVESARTRDLLRRTARVVWLRTSPETAWARVEGSGRPLATDRARFARRAARREPAYREVADLEVDAEGQIDEIVARVAAWALREVKA